MASLGVTSVKVVGYSVELGVPWWPGVETRRSPAESFPNGRAHGGPGDTPRDVESWQELEPPRAHPETKEFPPAPPGVH